MKLIIVGPRSIGKSTTGKVLAEKFNLDYFDFDEYIEDKLGGIDRHIKKNGVESYRVREERILLDFISELPDEFVISVGGGTVASQFEEISQRNTKVLKRLGKIIYLSPSENKNEAINILFEREKKRGGNKDYDETLKLFELRKSIYENLFDIKIEVKGKSTLQVIDDILLKLK